MLSFVSVRALLDLSMHVARPSLLVDIVSEVAILDVPKSDCVRALDKLAVAASLNYALVAAEVHREKGGDLERERWLIRIVRRNEATFPVLFRHINLGLINNKDTFNF